MGTALKGDFIGFWIGNTHSSELGIIRTSDGSRFNENLLPTIQDKTIQVPGGDGYYYFGSSYTQRQFSIPIAFDDMSEKQFRQLRQIIGNKEMVQLVFDETPYKYYNVKSTGSPTLKYICFDDEKADTKSRIYKGEGTLNFIAYDPFGYTRALSLAELCDPKGAKITDTSEWTFKIKDGTGEYDYPLPKTVQQGAWSSSDAKEGKMAPFFNSSDVPCDYTIDCTVKVNSEGDYEDVIITIFNYQGEEEPTTDELESIDTDIVLQLSLPPRLVYRGVGIEDSEGVISIESKWRFDSKTNCVYKWVNDKVDYSTVYNQYLTAYRFGKLPVGSQSLWVFGISEPPAITANYKYY